MVSYLQWTTDGTCSQTNVEQTNVSNHLEIVQQVVANMSRSINCLGCIFSKQFEKYLFLFVYILLLYYILKFKNQKKKMQYIHFSRI